MTPKAPKQKWTSRVTSNCFCTERGKKNQQNEKAAYRMKENICKLHGWKSESESRSVMSDFLQPHGLYSPWNSLGQNTGVGSLSLLQGIFPIQGSNPGLLHCILYQLSHQGSPRILEWVASPFSRVSSWPRELNRGVLHCR